MKSGSRIVLRAKGRFHRKTIYRDGNIVHKEPSPWTATVHGLLRYLESIGFTAAPRVVGSGFDSDGYETLSYIEGEFIDPGPWTEVGAFSVGTLLRNLHKATGTYQPPEESIWFPWFGRSLGNATRIISHCDFAPWNIVTQNGLPVALIDWDNAGPVDPLIELAQACWLNAKLHDDLVANTEKLPALSVRARHLRAIVDGYELEKPKRVGLVDLMIDYAIHSVAAEADEANIVPKMASSDVDAEVVYAMAWRSRAAVWMLRNRNILESALF